MSDKVTARPTQVPSFIGYAARVLDHTERVDQHTESEKSELLQVTLDTVTPPDALSWSGCYAWAAPAPRADGTVAMSLSTDIEAVSHFYAEGKEVFNLKSFGDPLSRFTTEWYGLFEATAHLDLFAAGRQFDQDWVLFAPIDGPYGIVGEIAWGRFPDREPGPEITDARRAALHAAYVEALRTGDIDAVLATMTDDVVGASRAYAGYDETFVALHGRTDVRSYYERLFAAYEALDVRAVTFLMRGWYLFTELVWQVRDKASGERLSFVTAELLVLDVDGRVWAKAGFGTQAEPLP